MLLAGNLATMPLPDLLQWIGGAAKTGRLEVERNKVCKNILLRGGRLIGCTSDEPSDMIGHHLVSHGRISEASLREALHRQASEHRPLGEILVSMSALSGDELRRHLEQKTEEAIFGLFEWSDGEFRFHEGEIDDANLVAVDLRVQDVLLRGAQRLDESRQIREVLDDPGIVLACTSRPVPPEISRNRMAKAILALVNGDRTIAEILLHAHASEFVVTKFLFEFHRLGIVEIVERKRLTRDRKAEPAPTGAGRAVTEPAPGNRGSAEAAAVAAPAAAPAGTALDPADLELVRKLMARGEDEAAIDLLDRADKLRPGDASLRAMLVEAEAAFVERAYRHFLPTDRVPVLTRPLESLTGEDLSPVEVFLASRINGSWDVRSIIQIAPIREIEALRTLKRLREKGLLDLKVAR